MLPLFLASCILQKDWRRGCCRSKSLLIVVVINCHHQNLLLLPRVGPHAHWRHQLGLWHCVLSRARIRGVPY
uniref:Uncharacterized protein n=1 Tax=Arundo donax TaxID=35708 RepID=A0A0A9M854_ARUDO